MLKRIGCCLARQRIGVVRVDLERPLESGSRRIICVLRGLRLLLPKQSPSPHGKIDHIGIFGVDAFFRFRLDEFHPKMFANSPPPDLAA